MIGHVYVHAAGCVQETDLTSGTETQALRSRGVSTLSSTSANRLSSLVICGAGGLGKNQMPIGGVGYRQKVGRMVGRWVDEQ